MVDVTFFVPDHLKKRAIDGLVNFIADRADQLGNNQAAKNIRKLSTQAAFLDSADKAFQAGIKRFTTNYAERDEDLVDAIVSDANFWESQDVQDALISIVAHPGAALYDELETIAHHFTWILPKRLNRDRVDRAVSYLLQCISEELWTLPGASEIRDVYSLQFQKMTAEATREQLSIARRQLEATEALTADIREALLQLTDASERKLLAVADLEAGRSTPLPYYNLPQPSFVRFIGREKELAWLKERLSPCDRAWQIAITGIGGVGKSALALAVAQDYCGHYGSLPEGDRFDAIIWVSAKEEILTASGREPAAVDGQILRTLEDIYRAIAQTLDREDITGALPHDQAPLVERALKKQRTLLVLDNMESITDERIKPFLRHLPAPTKVIVTSREWLDVADVLPLTGMSWDEAHSLLISEANNRGVTLLTEQFRRIYDLTSGLPLPLKLAIAQLSSGRSFQAVDRWLGDRTGDLPEYCVRGQIALVQERDPNTMPILFACSLFDREAGASVEALQHIGEISIVDCDQALTELQRLYLVNQTRSGRYWTLPIVQRYVAVALDSDIEGQALVERWIVWFVDLARKHGYSFESDFASRAILRDEYLNLRAVIQACREQLRWVELTELFKGIWPYLYRTGLFADLDEFLGLWLEAAHARSDELELGRVYLQTGRLAQIRNQAELVIEFLNRAEPILEKYGDIAGIFEIKATRAHIYQNNGNIEMAERYAEELLLLSEDSLNAEWKCRAAYHMAGNAIYREDFKVASKWLEKASYWASQLNIPDKTNTINYIHATYFIGLRKYTEAEPYLHAAIESNRMLGQRRYLAHDLFRMAEVYANTGRMTEAYQAGAEALDLFERLGMTHKAAEAQELIQAL